MYVCMYVCIYNVHICQQVVCIFSWQTKFLVFFFTEPQKLFSYFLHFIASSKKKLRLALFLADVVLESCQRF